MSKLKNLTKVSDFRPRFINVPPPGVWVMLALILSLASVTFAQHEKKVTVSFPVQASRVLVYDVALDKITITGHEAEILKFANHGGIIHELCDTLSLTAVQRKAWREKFVSRMRTSITSAAPSSICQTNPSISVFIKDPKSFLKIYENAKAHKYKPDTLCMKNGGAAFSIAVGSTLVEFSSLGDFGNSGKEVTPKKAVSVH